MKQFTSEMINDHIYKINTFNNVYCYLIVGTRKACLIDTGYGVGDLRSYVESLTDKPIFVIISHAHIDHICGAGLFDEVYLSPYDTELYPDAYDLKRRIANFEASRSWSDWASDYVMADINCYRTEPFLPLYDRDEFDLGGITLQAVNVPGHTRGMMMILIREDRIMFVGDGCTKHTYLHTSGSLPVEGLLEGLKYLKQYDDQYDVMIRSHNSYTQPKSVLDENIRLCQLILKGEDAAQEVTVGGQKVCSAAREDERQQRLDGVSGNIYYLKERIFLKDA